MTEPYGIYVQTRLRKAKVSVILRSKEENPLKEVRFRDLERHASFLVGKPRKLIALINSSNNSILNCLSK